MMTNDMPKKSKRLPVVLLGMVVVLLLSFRLAVPAMAAEPIAPHLYHEGQTLQVQGPRQVLRDDLTVEGGQVIDEDVLVYSGNVDVKDGGRITGDLVVFSGNIYIDENSAVEGDVAAYSGDIKVSGQVGGDIANWSGNVELASTAQVNGDIGVVSGSIERDEGATVGGNVVQGPSFRFPGSAAPDAPSAPDGVSFRGNSPSFFGKIINFIGRLFVAGLMTAFVMLLVGGLFYLRPQLIADTRQQLKQQLALSTVIGVAVNLAGFFLVWLLAITFCLFPVALVVMLLLLAVNVVGWAVASQIVGERIVALAKREIQPALTILVGALFLTGISALLWAFGGCFRPFAFLLLLVVSSLGTGAALVPWINRRRSDGGASGEDGGALQPFGPVPPSAAPTYGEPVETDVAAPLDYVTAEEINAAARGAVASSAQDATKTQASSAKAAGREVAEDDVVENQVIEQDVAAPIDYLTAQEVITTETVTEGDDFLRIRGIGPVYARRLKDAGYATFSQLAVASPEEVSAAIGWPVDRVRRAEVIDQAKVLMQ